MFSRRLSMSAFSHQLTVIGTLSISLLATNLFASELLPVLRTHWTPWRDNLENGHWATGEATRIWTMAGGTEFMSSAQNWNPQITPIAGDDVSFGTLRPGNYSVVENLAAVLGNLTINRALSWEQSNFSGSLSGSSFRVAKGVASVNMSAFSVTTPGATNSDSSIVVGDGLNASGTLVFTVPGGRYVDARVGVNGATGSLQILGSLTSLTPRFVGTTESVFGGTADTANATILVDGAALDAWVITTGIRGTTTFTNDARVTSLPTTTGTGQIQIGSPDLSDVTLEVLNSADLRLTGEDGVVLIGSGAGATTTTRFLSGGSLITDFVITGAESAAGTAASTNTITISGANTTVTTTEAFDTNGGYRFSNNRRGTTSLNITAGGRVFTPRFDSNAADRGSAAGAASTTSLLVEGIGSLLSARTDTGGLFVGCLGDYTSDTTTVRNRGKIDAGQITLGVGIGSTSTLNLAGNADVVTGLIELARPFRAGPLTTANLSVSGASKLICANLVTACSLTSSVSIFLSDPISSIQSGGVAIFGGVEGEALGGGNTTFVITNGANANFVALEAGGASAEGAGTGYTGTQITLTGNGTSLSLLGAAGATPDPSDIASNLLLSVGSETKSTVTVSGGAGLRLVDNDANPNRDGSIAIANGNGTVATLIVDGPGSIVDAGKLISMAQVPTANAFTNATATLTVRNGGFVAVYENALDPASGNLQMGIRPSVGSTATLNIGGGVLPDDADTTLAVDGTLFVGGTGETAPLPGSMSTVNVKNGTLAAAAIAVYANSRLNYTGGKVSSDNLAVLGGRVDFSTTTPLAMELGAIRAANGGVINIGKGGAVVYYSTSNGSPTDLVTIRQLILNGSNSGAWNGSNGITSSLLSPSTPRYAIGYADIDAVAMASFLDVVFSPETEAVVFRYTLRGDFNLDGFVSFDDLLILAQNYNLAGTRDWFQGDANYDLHANFDDLLLLAQNFGTNLLTDAVSIDLIGHPDLARDWIRARLLVPEPASLLAAFFGVFFMRRRPVLTASPRILTQIHIP